MTVKPPPSGFSGRTYSLRPDESASDGYYTLIGQIADSLLQKGIAVSDLLDTVRWLGASKRNIRRLLRLHQSTPDTRLLRTLSSAMGEFTTATAEHLRKLRGFDRLDRTLATTEEQHHLFMLEIELGNRFYAEQFRNADLKIAMLPHCLRDLDPE